MEIVLPDLSNQTDLTSLNWDHVLKKLVDLTRYCQDEENRYKSFLQIFSLCLQTHVNVHVTCVHSIFMIAT